MEIYRFEHIVQFHFPDFYHLRRFVPFSIIMLLKSIVKAAIEAHHFRQQDQLMFTLLPCYFDGY